MSRESFLREAAYFAEGVPYHSDEKEKKFCITAGFKVRCDLPRCKDRCQFLEDEYREEN